MVEYTVQTVVLFAVVLLSLSFFFFFFLEPLKLLKVEGLREGRMTVNQDPALSPGKVEGNTFERGNTIRDNNHCLKIYFKQ